MTTLSWIILAILGGFAAGRLSPEEIDAASSVIGRWIVRAAIAACVVGGVWLIIRAGRHADGDRAGYAFAAAALSIAGVTWLLFTAGKPRRTATEEIAWVEKSKKRAKVGDEVPEEIANEPRYADRVKTVHVAKVTFAYTLGGDEHSATKDTEVSDEVATLAAAAGKVTSSHRATKRFTYSLEVERSIAAGASVPDDVAGLAAAAGKFTSQRGWSFASLVVGKDGRWSTSKLQPLLWTFAVLFGLVSFFWLAEALDPQGKTDFAKDDLPDEYYLLLGGPFAAAIVAKAFTSWKVENGTVVKPDAERTWNPIEGISQAVSDDAGNVDLVDMQYFLFNLVALAVYLALLARHLSEGFPSIPEPIFGLTSAAALAYVTKKGVERSVPTVTSVVPARVRPGDSVEVTGQNLVPDHVTPPAVQVGGRKAAAVEVTPSDARGVDRITVAIPPSVETGVQKLVVVPVGGAPSAGTDLEVVGIAISAVTPDPVPDDTGTIVSISGSGFGEDTGGEVHLGARKLLVVSWAPTQIVASLPRPLGIASAKGVVLRVTGGGSEGTHAVQVQGLSVGAVRPSPIRLTAGTRIVVPGTGLGDERLKARLDGQRLEIVSRSETELVARLDPELLERKQYAEADEASLTLSRDGGPVAKATVSVEAAS